MENNQLLTNADLNRAQTLLTTIAKAVLDKIVIKKINLSFNLHRDRRFLEDEFEKAIKYHCNKLITAAKVGPTVLKELNDGKDKRKKARKALSDELRSSRNKLKQLNFEIVNAEKIAKRQVTKKCLEERKLWAKRLSSAKERLIKICETHERESLAWADNVKSIIDKSLLCNLYPDVPLPTFKPNKEGYSLPAASGVYFLWSRDEIEYVGQAKKLCQRLRLGNHHILRPDHLISFVFIDS